MGRLRFSWSESEKTTTNDNSSVLRKAEPDTKVIAPAPVLDRAAPAFAAPIIGQADQDFIQLVQSRLLAEPDPSSSRLESEPNYFHNRIAAIAQEISEQMDRVISEREKARLIRLAQAEILGLGPIEEFLADDTVSEIMVNGPHKVWVERNGQLYKTGIRFQDDEHVRRIIGRIIAPLGRRCDDSSPMVDARLPDGSRVNAIIPPLCLNGPSLTIRKFSRVPLTGTDLVTRGAMTAELLEFLRACVIGKVNIMVSGGTGTGKTTMLNVLSSFIPENERIITIENAAELRLQQDHVMTLESRPANLEGKGEINIRDLVVNALRMRPDRIIVGECRSAEALDMLQAMNTGHDGSMTTVHANTPRDALHRLETMSLMAGLDLPQRAIREQIASALHLIVQVERFQDGSRRISRVAEITGMERDVIAMSDLFVFKHQGVQNDKVIGSIQPTGIRPRFIERFRQHDVNLSPQVFGYTMRPSE